MESSSLTPSPLDDRIIQISNISSAVQVDSPLLLCHVRSGCHGNVILEDNSGSTFCKFIDLPFHLMGTQLLVTHWRYLINSHSSYVEVMKYQTLQSVVIPEVINTSSSKHMFNVEAFVFSVSSLIRRQPSQELCLAYLQDGDVYHPLIAMTPSLLHIAQLLQPYKCYLFTDLLDSIINKHLPTQRRVLATTTSTQIFHINEPEKACLSPSPSNLVSYQGVITRSICPEGGVYELDHSVWFCLHSNMSDLGLRVGASVRLTHCHVVDCQFWRGFYCCCISHLSISNFSSTATSYTPLLARWNRLLHLISQYSPLDKMWLLYAYSTLKDRLQTIIEHVPLLQLLVKLAHLFSFKEIKHDDIINSFFSIPHDCGYILSSDSAHSLLIPISSCIRPLNAVAKRPTAMWAYSVTENSNALLVGHVTGSDVTGCFVLKDSSGSVHIISPTLSLACHWLLIKEYQVITEYITWSHPTSSEHKRMYEIHYIIPLYWEVCPLSSPPIPAQDVKTSLYFVLFRKNHFNRLRQHEIEVIAHNDVKELQLLLSNGNTAHSRYVFQLSTIHYYPFLQYGHLYRLTSKNIVYPPLYHVTKDDIFELIEQEDSTQVWQINEIISISILLSSIDKRRDSLVSFVGEVMNHTFRLDQTAKTICSINSTVSTTDISASLFHEEFNSEAVLALQVKTGLDSIMVYADLKSICIPLGLLPGTVITCYNFLLKVSRSGNAYCSQCTYSSIDLSSRPLSQTATVPVPIITLLSHLDNGHLNSSQNVLLVQGHIVAIQHVQLQYICGQCKTVCTSDHKEICTYPNSIFRATARIILDDGSGEAHLYCDNDVIPLVLNITSSQWTQLKEHTQINGQLNYIRNKTNFVSMDSTNSSELTLVVNRNCVYRFIKASVRPFTSKPEQDLRKKKGYKSMSVNVGYHDYTTLTHGRLQLKLISFAPFNVISACSSLLADIN